MFFDLTEPTDHAKRTATVTYRCPVELELKLQAIANAKEITLSELQYRIALAYVAQWETAYLKVKQAFEACPDLPSKQGA